MTFAPATSFPLESVSETARGMAKSVPSCASWEVPAPATIAYAADARSVSVKVASLLTALTLAWTVKVPVPVPAKRSGLVAAPDSFVCVLVEVPPPTKLASAPFVGTTVKVTVASATGAP